MSSQHHTLQVATRGKGLYPFTREVAKWVASTGVRDGLLTVFVQHTSASLVIQENADPDVVLDLADFFERLVPENDPRYRHTTEGSDDMPAHIRAALTQTSLSIPVIDGRMALGPGRAFICSSTGLSPTGAASCCICWVELWGGPRSAIYRHRAGRGRPTRTGGPPHSTAPCGGASAGSPGLPDRRTKDRLSTGLGAVAAAAMAIGAGSS